MLRPLERDVQRVAVVAGAGADLARHVHVGQEVHLDADVAVARAGVAATAGHVEGEPAGLVAPDPRLVGPREELADVVEHPRVGGGVGAGRAPDGLLVDVDDLVEGRDPVDAPVAPGDRARAVHLLHERPVEDVVHQGALAGARHAGHGDEAPQRDLHIQVLEVVLARPAHDQPVVAGRSAQRRHRDAALAAEVLAGERRLVAQQCLDGAAVDDVAATSARAGPDVHHVVGGADGLLVVLHDDHRVAEIPEAQQCLQQAGVVALVQPDGRLVQHVEHPHEAAADL